MKQFSILLRRHHLLRDILVGIAATVVSCGVAASWRSSTHPDDRLAVYSALTTHDLTSVTIDQDQVKGSIRLSGVVANPDSRDLAQQLAEHAAPGYTIENEIQINRAGLM
jgi:hypothetical protein